MSERSRLFVAALLAAVAWSQAAAGETVLKRGNGAEPETLDVHKSSGVPEANIQRDLFEGLVAEAADGSLIPGAAESWEVSVEGTVYTFHLRGDGRWSDGRPVTAQDFVYAYRRALDPKTASDYAFILWPIANAEAATKGDEGALANLGVRALDERTLVITLKAPTPYFLGLLTHHMAYPVPGWAIEAHRRRWTRPGNMVSNGPYRLAEWVPQSHIKLVPNEHYRDRARLAIDTVVYYPTEDANAELRQFRAGDLDATATVPTGQMAWVTEHLKGALRRSPYLGTYYYAFNVSAPPFKDSVDLRRALSLAIDRRIITEKVTRGREIPAFTWVPPGVAGYTPPEAPEAAMSQAEREDLARELFRRARGGNAAPLELELLYNTSEDHKKIAVAVAAMWKKVLGVEVSLRNEEWKVYLNSRTSMDFQVARAGWIGDYNDANTFLELFKSDVGDMNPSGYSDAEYDRLMHAAEVERVPATRAGLMRRAEAIMLAAAPIIPIYVYTTRHLVSPRVEGWIDNVMNVHPSRFLSLAR